jgi:hypothetical protein
MTFAAWMPSRIGEPFEDWEDARILDDFDAGCRAWIIAKRARRTELEVVERLSQLGKSFDDQPKRRKMRRVIGT